MSALPIVTAAQVAALLTPRRALELVRQVFIDMASGEAAHQPRRRVRSAGAMLHTMSAASRKSGLLIWKNYVTHRQGAQFLVGAHDEQGKLLALIEADVLGQLRTAAATALALECLAPQVRGTLGLVGTGKQAMAQLRALVEVGVVDRCRVYSRTADRLHQFCQTAISELSLTIEASPSCEQATTNAEIIVTATTARSPFLEHKHLDACRFLAAVGSNWPDRAELLPEVVERAGAVVCDDLAACQLEAGDLIQCDALSRWSWSAAGELCEYVSMAKPAPPIDTGYVLFKSVGIATEDLALAQEVLQAMGLHPNA